MHTLTTHKKRDRTMHELIERLYDLGFESIAGEIKEGYTTRIEFLSYFDDIENARKACTEEEFSTQEYKEVLDILTRLDAHYTEPLPTHTHPKEDNNTMKVLIYTCKGITSAHLVKESEVLPYLFKLLAKDCYYDSLMSDMHSILADNDITFQILDPITQEV